MAAISRVKAAAADAACVVLFGMFGRGAHSKGFGLGEVWSTVWPFGIGLAAGWLVVLGLRRRPEAVASGVLVWGLTLGVGMVIWGTREGRVPHWSFLLVAGVATASLLLGWRAVLAWRGRRAVA